MGKRVIYVNPVTMGAENWNMYMAETKARLLSGEEVNNLVCSFSNLELGPHVDGAIAAGSTFAPFSTP